MRLSKTYSNEATTYSKAELLKFLKFGETHSIEAPFLIGGWAVYAYGSEYGSLDIDLVFRKKESIEMTRKFFTENHYDIIREGEDIHFLKKITIDVKGNKKQIEIWFDTFHFEEANALADNKNIEVPWKLLADYNRELQIDKLKVLVPEPELLLIYKAKALYDREWRLRNMLEGGIAGNRERFRIKIGKDEQDIRGLLAKAGVKAGKVEEIIGRTNFGKYYNEVMGRFGQIKA